MRRAAEVDPDEFVKQELLDGLPFAFGSNLLRYEKFKEELGAVLGQPSEALRLVGSGKLGFSLHQDHLLRPFGPKSDLDMVVVASDLFDTTALELAQRAEAFSLAGEDERRRLRKSKENIFSGFLRPDQLPLSCNLSRDWFPRLAGPFRNDTARRHTVTAWLFKSVDHAAIAYSAHHRRVQPAIHKLLSVRGEL